MAAAQLSAVASPVTPAISLPLYPRRASLSESAALRLMSGRLSRKSRSELFPTDITTLRCSRTCAAAGVVAPPAVGPAATDGEDAPQDPAAGFAETVDPARPEDGFPPPESRVPAPVPRAS